MQDILKRIQTNRSINHGLDFKLHEEVHLSVTEKNELKSFFVDEWGVVWNPRFEELLNISAKIYFTWQNSNEKEGNFGGEVCLYNPLYALKNNYISLFEGDIKTPDYFDKYFLDAHPFTGDNCMTLICLNEAMDDFLLYYFDSRSIFKLNLSLENYLNWVSYTMGYFHWQLFTEKTNSSNSYEKEYTKMINELKKSFPETDYNKINI